jgi:hypothetical protein
MTYGLRVTGADGSGSYLVADTDKDLVNYAVVATGTASSVNLGSTQGRRPILLINANSSGNTAKIISTKFAGYARAFYKYTYTTYSNGSLSVDSESTATVDYVLLKDMTGIANATGSGDYGLRVKTAAGDVAVDSRRFLTDIRFLLKNVWGPGTRGGNGYAVFSTDPDEFIDTSWMAAFGSANSAEGFSIAGALFNPSGGSSNAGIKHFNFLEDIGSFGEGGGGGSSGQNTVYFSNFSTVMTGQKYT